MKLIQVHTSNSTSVILILNAVNWHHSVSKSLTTLSGAMEIPPVKCHGGKSCDLHR